MLANGNAPHALCFSGPDGVGKRQCGLALTQGLLCMDKQDKPCGICQGCRNISDLSHPDLYIVEPDGKSRTIKISQIKAIKKELVMKPIAGLVRVALIDEADRMNPEAQNALLKMLEEPPAYVYFILVTAYPQKLLTTVLSRCQRLRFGSLNARYLESIAKSADLEIDDMELSMKAAHGSMAELEDLGQPLYKDIFAAVFNLMQLTRTKEICPMPDWGQNKEEERMGLDALLRIFRDIYVLKTGAQSGYAHLIEREAELDDMGKRFSIEDIERITLKLNELKLDLEHSIHPKLIMNTALNTIGINII
ncbi:MAG: DNA polymerase-3 subunit delta' [Candidatus Omnitrophota bacterium]|jgi:DNA polymerase-3 subunit delta'